ncbi:pantoate--beta-alanine ligase [Aeromicrobium sp. A1-2]|uniref:pantoate--beta-alanine ligase n=1 Tax=Aeromicrobium sp. A1-2 TaxID=2107713 RepID=UPI000E51C4D5|nr:pantoate--beta-alanine ligase [Aeromicrobium sp. A1-2]AXT83850.1 pantoate--beta-alanine ligase [Aeromicrobium sp. A1-2]
MTGPIIARTRAELLAAHGGSSVSFVPTMGALHDGHLQLLEHARPLGETLVASIFVNPTQFAPDEDFDAYPRTFDADLDVCARAGVDVVFAPSVPTMYPAGPGDSISVDPGPLGTVLEGSARPTHFRGVLTVVAKLFGLVRPDVAVFGEKDYQQLTLIRHLSRELALGVDIVGCPTVREPDGLAMSSRNRYLSEDDRKRAAYVSAALRAGVSAGPRGAESVLVAAAAVLETAGINPDYLVVTDPDLGPARPGAEARLLVAARVGTPRLLDNTSLTLGA